MKKLLISMTVLFLLVINIFIWTNVYSLYKEFSLGQAKSTSITKEVQQTEENKINNTEKNDINNIENESKSKEEVVQVPQESVEVGEKMELQEEQEEVPKNFTTSKFSQSSINGQIGDDFPDEEKFALGNDGACCDLDEDLSEVPMEDPLINTFNGKAVLHVKQGETVEVRNVPSDLTWINGEISHRDGYVNAFTLSVNIGSYQNENLIGEESYFNKGQSYELHTVSKEGINVWVAIRGEGSDPIVRVKHNISIAYDTTPGIYSVEPEYTIYEVGRLPSAKVFRLSKYYIQVIK